jgi:hypothetical protein
MPKKIPIAVMQKWRELRSQGYSCEKVGEITGGYSRRTVEKYTQEPKEEKKKAEAGGPDGSVFLYLQRWGELLLHRCPYAKQMKDGYCPQAEFPADEWSVELSKKIFPDIVIKEKRGKEFIRPKVPPWYCAFCGLIKSVEGKVAEADGKMKRVVREVHSETSKQLSEQRRFIKIAKEELIIASFSAGKTAALEVLKESNSMIKGMRGLLIFFDTLREEGEHRRANCINRNPVYCMAWPFKRVPKFALKSILHEGYYRIDPHPCWCATCIFYQPQGTTSMSNIRS